MNITWVTRSFLDYRIPIYIELNKLCNNNLSVLYYKDVVPERCQEKLRAVLGERAVGLTGEFRICGKKNQPLSSMKNNFHRIPIQPGLLKTIKKTKPAIILTDGFFQWTYAAYLYKIFYKIPHIMLYEGTEHTERNVGLLKIKFRKLASQFIDVIHCNGVLCEAFLKNVLNIKQSKISIGNMASDVTTLQESCKQFSENEKLIFKKSLHLKGNVFLFVGRLVPLKGLNYLLEVWKNLNLENFSLLIVGNGEQAQELREYSDKYGLKNIFFEKAVSNDIIYKYFTIADCFIIPTLQDNWSLVVPEAMSCKLPIICSKYNGCHPELVKSVNGWVFDPLNKRSFLETLNTAVKNKNKWKKMGEASLELIEDFSPKIVSTQIFESCRKIINHK